MSSDLSSLVDYVWDHRPSVIVLLVVGVFVLVGLLIDSYLHVYVELHEGLRDAFPTTDDGLRPVKVFAHYVGDQPDKMRQRFSRVHNDLLYELRLA